MRSRRSSSLRMFSDIACANSRRGHRASGFLCTATPARSARRISRFQWRNTADSALLGALLGSSSAQQRSLGTHTLRASHRAPRNFLSAMVLAADGRRICGTPGCNLPDFHKGPCAGWAPKKRVSQPVMQLNVRPEPVRSRAPAKPKRPYYPPKPKTAEELAAEAAAEAAARKPAEQRVLPSGLWPFYHAHRWGVPLPPGPVPPDEGSDDELDETWRAREAERRIDGRRGVDPADAELMKLWNAHVAASEKLVSDRALPAACRVRARARRRALDPPATAAPRAPPHALRPPAAPPRRRPRLPPHRRRRRRRSRRQWGVVRARRSARRAAVRPRHRRQRPTVPTATACSARGCSCGRRCATSAAGRSTRRVARSEAASEARRRGRCRRRRRDRQRNPSQRGLFCKYKCADLADGPGRAAAASSGCRRRSATTSPRRSA